MNTSFMPRHDGQYQKGYSAVQSFIPLNVLVPSEMS
jgi:hypothetical protein